MTKKCALLHTQRLPVNRLKHTNLTVKQLPHKTYYHISWYKSEDNITNTYKIRKFIINKANV